MSENDNKLAAVPVAAQTSQSKKVIEEKYELCGGPISQGSYGKVYKAKNLETNKLVAVKVFLEPDERSNQREIEVLDYLRQTPNPNVIEYYQLCWDNSLLDCLILEWSDYSLKEVLYDQRKPLSAAEKKGIIQQIMNGLKFLHGKGIIHRDLTPRNVLVNKAGRLQICDFGLSKLFRAGDDTSMGLSREVCTLWYRPAEIILGYDRSCAELDLWSAGCIIGEVYKRMPLMPGEDPQNQLKKIQNLCGSVAAAWPEATNLDLFNHYSLRDALNPNKKSKLWSELQHVKDVRDSFHIVNRLLSLDPKNRGRADQYLEDSTFSESPLPSVIEFNQ